MLRDVRHTAFAPEFLVSPRHPLPSSGRGPSRRGQLRLLGLPDACRLPQTALLDGKQPWAEVKVGWNPQGLAVEIEAEGKLDTLGNDERPEVGFGVQLWIDTRDTRNVSRATRFCHRFDARILTGTARDAVRVSIQQKPIARGKRGRCPDRKEPVDRVSDRKTENTLAAGGVLAFGNAARVRSRDEPAARFRVSEFMDPDRGGEFLAEWGLAQFPVGENPSLWSTLELREPE